MKERFATGEIAMRANEDVPELGGEEDMPRLLGSFAPKWSKSVT